RTRRRTRRRGAFSRSRCGGGVGSAAPVLGERGERRRLSTPVRHFSLHNACYAYSHRAIRTRERPTRPPIQPPAHLVLRNEPDPVARSHDRPTALSTGPADSSHRAQGIADSPVARSLAPRL